MTAKAPLTFLALAALGLSACAPAAFAPASVAAPAAAPLTPRARLVAAIEAQGCVLTRDNLPAVLLRANLTQAELPPLIADLEGEGRIESPDPERRTLRILSDNCI